MTIAPPSILSSRVFPGMGLSSVQGNLTWNDDGQAGFFTSRGVTILTPTLISTLPPPPAYLDPTAEIDHPSRKVSEFRRSEAAKAKQGMEIDEDVDGQSDGAGPSAPSIEGYRKVRRPMNGEVGLYVNGVDTRNVDRTAVYEWIEVGDEFSAPLAEEEINPKAIAWSPSGLSDLGSCLLAVMTSQGQVSVYAPSSDPYMKRWEEIADLTILTRATLPKQLTKPLSIPGMLQMRATCLRWSQAVPHNELLSVDLSLLAIANRAGKVAFWSYGPLRRFAKTISAEVTTGLVVHMAWAPWQSAGEATFIARLALACSDGTVAVLHIRQTVQTGEDGRIQRKVDVVRDEKVPDPDRRALTGLMWLDDILVYSRPGSVSFWLPAVTGAAAWPRSKRVVLPQIGNWAGANSYCACVGFERLGSDSLIVALSTQLFFIITDITTSPRIAASEDNLNLSIAGRQLFLDHVQASVFESRESTTQDAFTRNLSTQILGWGGVGEPGLFAWAGETINLHSLEHHPEGQRRVNFVIADMGGWVAGRRPVIEDLEGLLEDPPSATHTAPLKALLPHLLRITSSADQIGISSELLDLLSADSQDDGQATTANTPSVNENSAMIALRRGLWTNIELSTMRLKYTLARWCSTTFRPAAKQFSAIASSALLSIQSTLSEMQLVWAASYLNSLKNNERDTAYLRLLIDALPSTANVSARQAVSQAMGGTESPPVASGADACPACGGDVSRGDASGTSRCKKGHEWSRCSITRLLVTIPNYRVCSTCPAISLMPTSCADTPIRVDEQGQDSDYTRSVDRPLADMPSSNGALSGLVDRLLEEAIVCLHCGGRWVRVF